MSQCMPWDLDITALDDTELAEVNIKTTSLLNTIQQEIYKRASENNLRALQDELDETQKELHNIRVLLGNNSEDESSESSDNHNTPPRDISSNYSLSSFVRNKDSISESNSSLPNTIITHNPPSNITSANTTTDTKLTPVVKEKTVKTPRTKYSSKRLRKRK